MLKTLKLFLLTITFALLGAFSAFAGEDSCGHLDFLNETGVSGWCYQNSQPSSPADFTLRIANVLTGDPGHHFPVPPRSGIQNRRREHARLFRFHRLGIPRQRSVHRFNCEQWKNRGQLTLLPRLRSRRAERAFGGHLLCPEPGKFPHYRILLLPKLQRRLGRAHQLRHHRRLRPHCSRRPAGNSHGKPPAYQRAGLHSRGHRRRSKGQPYRHLL